MAPKKKNHSVQEKLFEEVVARTIQELPRDLREALSTVQILIQPRPGTSPKKGTAEEGDLLGVFEGLSLKEWPARMERLLPDRIILYQDNLETSYPDREELKREIRKTLLHELGHYFGFNEKELRERGLE
jgi:predicted Zn-dependent protease with MMP-like domain